MKLFTPFAIPQKDNCDVCRDKSNKRREVVNLRLDQLLNSSSRALKNASSVMTEKKRFFRF